MFGHDRGQPFLGREFSAEPDYSDEVAREIDDEIRRMVEEAHQTAREILTDNRDELDRISKILLERETIEAEEFVALLEGKPEEEVFPPRRGGGRARRGRGGEEVRPRGAAPARAAEARAGRRRHRRDAPRTTPSQRPGQLEAMPRPAKLMGIVNVTPDSFSDGG